MSLSFGKGYNSTCVWLRVRLLQFTKSYYSTSSVWLQHEDICLISKRDETLIFCKTLRLNRLGNLKLTNFRISLRRKRKEIIWLFFPCLLSIKIQRNPQVLTHVTYNTCCVDISVYIAQVLDGNELFSSIVCLICFPIWRSLWITGYIFYLRR